MTLLKDFYSIIQLDSSTESVTAKILINKSHSIFNGHFPNLPIVPGVCMMQIVMEIMEAGTRGLVNLVSADSIKFLSVINPEQNQEIDVTILYTRDAGHAFIRATLFASAVTFFKLKATLAIT